MEFSYNKQNGSLKICMPPELDECSVKDMRSDADLLIDTYQVRHLIFDFSNTVFIHSLYLLPLVIYGQLWCGDADRTMQADALPDGDKQGDPCQ